MVKSLATTTNKTNKQLIAAFAVEIARAWTLGAKLSPGAPQAPGGNSQDPGGVFPCPNDRFCGLFIGALNRFSSFCPIMIKCAQSKHDNKTLRLVYFLSKSDINSKSY
jgi:hypothetical protein